MPSLVLLPLNNYRNVRQNAIILLLCLTALTGCRRVITQPKPRGYFRIAIPDTAYTVLGEKEAFRTFPYCFDLSDNAVAETVSDEHPYWMNIAYPTLKMKIHCTYEPVEHNLNVFLEDAHRFAYSNTNMTPSISARRFDNDSLHVHGLLYELGGNAATPYQFFLTDSTQHFFRGAVYCEFSPNVDSLAPVYDYIYTDVKELIESFQWQ